ncbi:MAG: transcription termination factor Rho [Eubacteriales bacterium]|nr:transcription termination factor Rho [Eubacteriales bacterium]
MPSAETLFAMTIAELRAHAKQAGVKLTGATTKAAIVERILAASGDKPGSRAPAPRRAMIITDDGEDTVPSVPVVRQTPEAKPTEGPKTTTSTGKNKPVFTLQGSRAWHNPQPFSQPQAPQSRYAPQMDQPISTFPRGQAVPQESRFASNLQPRIGVPKAAPRFGPDARTEMPEPSPIPIPQESDQRPAPSTDYRRPVFSDISARHEDRPPQETFQREPTAYSGATELLAAGDTGEGAGILEIQQDGYGFLRAGNLLPGKNDVYISGTQIRRFRLRNGDYVQGKTRPQRENDRYAAMLYITSINGEETDDTNKLDGSTGAQKIRREFDTLTPVYPDRRIRLSNRNDNDMVLRLIDLFVPVGFGQRAMIVAAPKAGKTTILKKIALSLKRNHPDIHSMMLLVDERPEEVTDLKETVGGEIFYSTFDEPAESHAKVSELTLERAMRLVEAGRDVVILMDSLTRLSRAYNNLMPSTARVMTGGLAAGALNKPKRFFGAARNMKEGGSLTIIATALVDTGSRMDGVIFEEFKGTGNMELTLDRALSERRLFPAVSLLKSGTRQDMLMLSQEEQDVAAKVRSMFSNTSEQESLPLLLSMFEKSRDNDEFVARFDDWMALMRGTR